MIYSQEIFGEKAQSDQVAYKIKKYTACKTITIILLLFVYHLCITYWLLFRLFITCIANE